MAYDQNATNQLIHRQDNVEDWIVAQPGQWFIGVIDTSNKNIFIVPVNVFEEGGKLNQETLDNTNMRGKNRYASGAPGDRLNEKRTLFGSFLGKNWLETKPVGTTHHTQVALHYGADPDDCLGFTLIKTTDGFGQLKFGSNSLNMKPQHTLSHSFSRATHNDQPHTTYNDDGTIAPSANTGSCQMPKNWQLELQSYLQGVPFAITYIAASDD